MAEATGNCTAMPIGVVVRRTPGVTRWARWAWRAVAVLPGAGPANWDVLRREGEAVEYHAATLPLVLWADQTEAYLVNLSDRVPSVYLVLRDSGAEHMPPEAVAVTASPYEAQDHSDAGDAMVEKIPMTEGLAAWVRDFTLARHRAESFVKRRRDSHRSDRQQDGVGDARIRQQTDVYRAPTTGAKDVVQ